MFCLVIAVHYSDLILFTLLWLNDNSLKDPSITTRVFIVGLYKIYWKLFIKLPVLGPSGTASGNTCIKIAKKTYFRYKWFEFKIRSHSSQVITLY